MASCSLLYSSLSGLDEVAYSTRGSSRTLTAAALAFAEAFLDDPMGPDAPLLTSLIAPPFAPPAALPDFPFAAAILSVYRYQTRLSAGKKRCFSLVGHVMSVCCVFTF